MKQLGLWGLQGGLCGLGLGIVTVLLGLLYPPLSLHAQADAVPVIRTAQVFVVRDAAGRMCATYGILEDGTSVALDLYDTAGTRRAVLLTSPDGSVRLKLSGAAGLTQLQLMADAHSEAVIFGDANGVSRTVLSSSVDGRNDLFFRDAKKQRRMGFSLIMEGRPFIAFEDARGTNRAAFSHEPAMLVFHDAQGEIAHVWKE